MLALLVLVATFVVATTSVAGGMASPASRTGIVERCEQPIVITVVAGGRTATDLVCSFGHSSTPESSG